MGSTSYSQYVVELVFNQVFQFPKLRSVTTRLSGKNIKKKGNTTLATGVANEIIERKKKEKNFLYT
jgi:hypothetical protein